MSKKIYIRQEGFVDTKKLSKAEVTIIGAGSVGSFTTLALAKMGVGDFTVYDDDYITEHNIPAQFYRTEDVDEFKGDAICRLVEDFSWSKIMDFKQRYIDQPLAKYVVVCPDNMRARADVWKQFCIQSEPEVLIEARMGGEYGQVYMIRKINGKVMKEDFLFYNEMLYSDGEVEDGKCTEKTIIYNVLTISAFISRAFKAAVMKEDYPREVTFDTRNLILMGRD